MTKQGNFTQRTPSRPPAGESRATKPLDRSLSRPLEAPMRRMIWSSQRWDRPWGQPRQPPQSQARKGLTTSHWKGSRLNWRRVISYLKTTRLWSPSCKRKQKRDQARAYKKEIKPEEEVSPPRHQKERREKDNRRPPVFGRIGNKVSGTQTATQQNLDTHENNDRRISVRDRLGSRDVHSRLGQRLSPSDSPPSSDSEDSRRKGRRRVSSSSEDSSDNEDAKTGH
ncbi:hypothetical protein Tco_1107743 [Tanacetum coccineum]